MTRNKTAHAYGREGGASFKGICHFHFYSLLFCYFHPNNIKITMDNFTFMFFIYHFTFILTLVSRIVVNFPLIYHFTFICKTTFLLSKIVAEVLIWFVNKCVIKKLSSASPMFFRRTWLQTRWRINLKIKSCK